MPGGSDVNEILWGIPYDAVELTPYGGTTFLCCAAISNLTVDNDGAYMNCEDYGLNQQWGCMHATKEFADKFASEPNDVRWSMWKKDVDGFKKENTAFSKFTDGYGVVKFTNLLRGSNGNFKKGEITKFPNTDLPLIRLADVYLMFAECAMRGAADKAKGVEYANYVRERAGVSAWTQTDLNEQNMIDERCRELYWENVRRTDLVRFGLFTGSKYTWSWKGNVDKGASIPDYMNVFPIPSSVIAAQPDFKQNPNY